MWCYRRVLRISLEEHKTNEKVLQAADVTEILLDQLLKRKLRHADHVIRGVSEHLLQLALEGRIESRRGRGCPKRSWTDDIKQWTHNRTFIIEKFKRKAESREEWRVIVVNLGTEESTYIYNI
ncbi:RNA-directed DNA polymerase from mobile element jockey [Elysia marginata]|uniref:RNA-directed DNA polymerase from mobile element jockey n=1 Tax=Elysia marginata TaxID=1093978 RepID=A0AAV4I1R0_9GAST|nr:RNA-directed DNA polymerase from mobile element jockey [Elysia marginata]